MGTNTCDVDYLDADSLLPPRKRLLAGLKRQSPDVNFPAPLTSIGNGSNYCNRLSNLLRSQFSNPNISNEEIFETSKFAALEAANIAVAARAKAEEKAEKAAKAMAAAKSALELVATLSEDIASKEKCPRKNKTKKHVPVQALYNNKKGYTDSKTDEDVARNLHRVINSSPRISKNSGPDLKNQKHRRQKNSTSSVKFFIDNGVLVPEGVPPSTSISNGNGFVKEVNTEGPVKEVDMITVDLNGSKSEKGGQPSLNNGEGHLTNKTDKLKLGNGELEPLPSKDKFIESLDSKKRGKMKQKKLPLSICNFRDQTILKDDTTNQPLFSVGLTGDCLVPVEKTTMWKCQSCKAPSSVKQNKVMQS